MRKRYQHLAVAGTFDLLHLGHKKLINTAFRLAARVTIGITSDKFALKKTQPVEKFISRKTKLVDYLIANAWFDRAKIIKIDDIFGPTLSDISLEALVVSQETKKNGQKVLQARLEKGLSRLDLIVIDPVKSTDGYIISSRRIRQGMINTDGDNFLNLFKRQAILSLPDNLRDTLQKPLGRVFINTKQTVRFLTEKDPSMIITVGDVITKALIKENIIPGLQIIDHKKQRQEIPAKFRIPEIVSSIKAKNAAGRISRTAVIAVNQALINYQKSRTPQQLIISGEEDLLALPAVLMTPLDSIILYGQPKKGVVTIMVDIALKEYFSQIIGKFNK